MNFNSSFSYSKFAVGILDLDSGFVGDDIQVRISKIFEASTDEPLTSISASVQNELADSGGVSGTVVKAEDVLVLDEDEEQVMVYIVDNGSGVLNAYRTDNNSLFKRDCGSVYYPTGRIQIDGLKIIRNFEILLRPKTNNVIAKANNLLNVVNDGITLIT